MQSIGKLVASQAEYYTNQLRHSVGEDVPVLRADRQPAQVDYYADHESPARWIGSGLGRIGLQSAGAVDTEVFAKLMKHSTPDGQSMVRPHARHGTVAAFDHTFSAPKSASLLYAFGGDRVRAEVTAAHQRAVEEGLGYMEERSSQSRVGSRYRDDQGNWRVRTRSADSEGYLAAAFDHFTSRANDPQIHTHVVVINRVWTEGGWRAIDAKRAYAHAKAGGSIYQAVLRDELTRRLGVSWQPVVNGQADIAGFSPELIRHFSTRRSEIAQAVQRYVAETGGQAHRRVWQAFTLETRQPKSHPKGETEVTREMKDYGVTADVLGHWQKRAMKAPEDVMAVVQAALSMGQSAQRPTPEHVEEAASRLFEWVSNRQAVFTERDLVAHVCSLFPEGARPPELVAATRTMLSIGQDAGQVLIVLPHAESGLILPEGITLSAEELDTAGGQGPGWITHNGTVRFRALPGEPRYTTLLHLQRESAVLDGVNTTSSVAVSPELLEEGINRRGLIEDQARAMRRLADLDGRVVAVVGPGGSGKTYAIGAYTDAALAAGYPVVGVATSAAAARQLGDDLGRAPWSGTIAMLRHHLDRYEENLAPGTVVVVDEASMVSTADLAWLVERVEECDGKLTLVGDPKQLPSVDSGGLFHRIVATGQQVVEDLSRVNQRQQLGLDRQTLAELRQGEIESAVRHYAEAGRLHLGRTEYATKRAMVDAWWADVQKDGVDRVRMLASRHDEVWMLNELARVRMTQAGHLTGPALLNRWGVKFQAGDRIVVRDNWYAHSDLRNGQTGVVLAIHVDAGSLSFRRDLDGQVIELPKRYLHRDVDHAYAQTIHTAQGQTFQLSHVYADAGVRAEHGYTALSRARGETHLWVNDAPGPLGGCTHIHGDPLTENRIEALVRQFSQSVIEAPALDQGLPVETATDRQLIDWRDELEAIIRHSPIATDPSDQIVALDAAIAEAREIAERLGTSGAQAQVQHLESQRITSLEEVARRGTWLGENVSLLHRYSAVTGELNHRIRGLAAAYEAAPPQDLVKFLGPKPAAHELARRWETAVAAYAEARLAVGPAANALDPALLATGCWRDVVLSHQQAHVGEIESIPMLRRVG